MIRNRLGASRSVLARLRLLAKNDHSRRHAIKKGLITWAVEQHLILALVTKLSPQNPVYNIAIIGQQDQAR